VQHRFSPACAGSPRSCIFRRRSYSVQPRVCGEPTVDNPIVALHCGSAPRVRGAPSPPIPARR